MLPFGWTSVHRTSLASNGWTALLGFRIWHLGSLPRHRRRGFWPFPADSMSPFRDPRNILAGSVTVAAPIWGLHLFPFLGEVAMEPARSVTTPSLFCPIRLCELCSCVFFVISGENVSRSASVIYTERRCSRIKYEFLSEMSRQYTAGVPLQNSWA